jgi:hypothetical protein
MAKIKGKSDRRIKWENDSFDRERNPKKIRVHSFLPDGAKKRREVIEKMKKDKDDPLAKSYRAMEKQRLKNK